MYAVMNREADELLIEWRAWNKSSFCLTLSLTLGRLFILNHFHGSNYFSVKPPIFATFYAVLVFLRKMRDVDQGNDFVNQNPGGLVAVLSLHSFYAMLFI